MRLQCGNTRASLVRTGLTAAKPHMRVGRRGIASKAVRQSMLTPPVKFLRATTPLAKQLLKSPLYYKDTAAKEEAPKAPGDEEYSKFGKFTRSLRGTGDKARVNIVSESLCDDVLKTLGPSLERHKGCDLIDIFPGVGLWSQKMNDILQPRSHIMMEPDVDVYTPFLQPLLDKPNTRLIPKSGILWSHVSGILTPEYLPHQTEIPIDPAVTPQRNDTLLVMANISYFPKRKFGSFASLSHLLLYQFASSLRSSGLFQKYGLVRMLLWVPPAERIPILPREITNRNRSAVEAELTTEWIIEVTQPNVSRIHFNYRDPDLDVESDLNVLERMRVAGIPLPPEERQSDTLKSLVREGAATVRLRNYEKELREMETRHAAGEFDNHRTQQGASMDPLTKRLRQLKYRTASEDKITLAIREILDEREKLVADIRDGNIDSAEREAREAAWNERVSTAQIRIKQSSLLRYHNTHLLRQDPPVLSWDRRPYVPMIVEPTEFLPNEPLCLLDIQPKAAHPLLRAIGTANDHAGDTLELLMRSIMTPTTQPISRALENSWPGAAEELLPKCPSLRDPSKGGSDLGGRYGEICVRELNEHHLVEIMEAWMAWPFRPTFRDLLARIGDNTSRAGVDEVDLNADEGV